MSSRSGVAPIAKVSSSENVCAKQKEDRPRSNNTTKFIAKQQRQEFNNQRNASASNHSRYNANNHKQPKTRNAHKSWGGRRNQVKSEQRDAFSPIPVEQHGSKKTNLNHLLNFTFESDADDFRVSNSARPKGSYNWHNSYKAVFNKEQFIQANCQLVVKSGPDYSAFQNDADLVIDWELVEKVNMWSPEIPLCPICLDEPYAARVTKCGHIYCWPCILHYLAIDDKKWRKCPICHEAVHKSDLKSVSVFKEQLYNQQQVITMQLMRRTKGSIVACPVTHDTESDADNSMFQFSGKKESSLMSRNLKHLVAEPDQVLENIVQVDMEELKFKLAVETDELEKQFIQSAIDLCKDWESNVMKSVTSHSEDNAILLDASVESTTPIKPLSPDGVKCISIKAESTKQCASMSDPHDRVYYFYQAKDGQHMYLHPLNVRCLVHQYGSFDKCPSEITGKILEMQDFTMNEGTRKRNRYLCHLPLSLEFHIIELDLRPPILHRGTLDFFRDQLERRSTQRKKKSRDEKRVLRKVQNEELRRQGKYPDARITLESQRQFPTFPGQSQPVSSSSSAASFSVLMTSRGSGGPDCYHDNAVLGAGKTPTSSNVSSLGSSVENAGPSFAQMLRSNEPGPPVWPRSIAPSQSSSASSLALSRDHDDDTDPSYVAPPSYQSSFGDALTSALDRLEAEKKEEPKNGGRGRKGKGKKGKKVLLFSTAGQHHQ